MSCKHWDEGMGSWALKKEQVQQNHLMILCGCTKHGAQNTSKCIHGILSPDEIYLKCGYGEEGNSNIPVTVVCNSLGFTAEFEAKAPTRDTNNVCRALASHMEVEPGRIGGLEHPQIPCYDSSKRHQNTPTHSIQHSMDLQSNSIIEHNAARLVDWFVNWNLYRLEIKIQKEYRGSSNWFRSSNN